MQNTSHILMIKPVNFGFNEETALNNTFQQKGFTRNVQEIASYEFDNFVDILRSNDINVTLIADTPTPYTPDSIFPNNWISFHAEGEICLYPMFAQNRRHERKSHVLDTIKAKLKYKQIVNFTHYEADNLFLEGTGSMVLDRVNKIAYACLSQRTHKIVLEDFCRILDYKPICFNAVDINNNSIYHTNVVMSVADKYVVLCTDTIKDEKERELVLKTIEDSEKKLINISYSQMNNFAGNMLQVINNKNELFLIMSNSAYNSLSEEQIELLNSYNKIIKVNLDIIEKNGGGSARCMLAEIFLPNL